jgi:glycosyltransferase involved in cell wall biosynthesis
MSERSGAQRNGSRLIAVGRLSPEKGLHVLLDAFDRIVEAHPRAELEIVGAEQMIPLVMLAAISEDEAVRSLAPLYRGSYEAELRRRLSERTESRVKFAGPVPHAAVAEHYRDADILVAPSFTESFGLPAAEAMAAGLPVVASGVGGLAEIVVDGETGFLVPPGDEGALAEAVLRLLGDVELRHRMGAAGRRRAEALFSWGRVAEELVRAYATA